MSSELKTFLLSFAGCLAALLVLSMVMKKMEEQKLAAAGPVKPVSAAPGLSSTVAVANGFFS